MSAKVSQPAIFAGAIQSASSSLSSPGVLPQADHCDVSARGDSDIDHRLWQSGRYHELRQRLSDELVQAEIAANDSRLQVISNNLACVYRALGDHVSAAQFQQQAASRECHQSRNGQLSTVSLSNLACDAFSAGDLLTAEGLFWKSLLGELANGDDAAAGSDWANLGLIANFQGDLEACRWRFWQALKRHHRAHDLLGVAMDLWHLGQSFESTGDWSVCRRMFERSERLFAQIGHSELRLAARLQKELATARECVTTFDVARN